MKPELSDIVTRATLDRTKKFVRYSDSFFPKKSFMGWITHLFRIELNHKNSDIFDPIYFEPGRYFIGKNINKNRLKNLCDDWTKNLFLVVSYDILEKMDKKNNLSKTTPNEYENTWEGLEKLTENSFYHNFLNNYFNFGSISIANALRKSSSETINTFLNNKEGVNKYIKLINKLSIKDSVTAKKVLSLPNSRIIADIDFFHNILKEDKIVKRKRRNHSYIAPKYKKNTILNELSYATKATVRRIQRKNKYTLANLDEATADESKVHQLINYFFWNKNDLSAFSKDIQETIRSALNIEKIINNTKITFKKYKQLYIHPEERSALSEWKHNIVHFDSRLIYKYGRLKRALDGNFMPERGIFDDQEYCREFLTLFSSELELSDKLINDLKDINRNLHSRDNFSFGIVELPENIIDSYLSDTRDCISYNYSNPEKKKFEEQGLNILRNEHSNFLELNAYQREIYEFNGIYRETNRIEFKHNMGRAIIFEAEMNKKEVLYVAGFLSDGFSKSSYLSKYYKWPEAIIEGLKNYASTYKKKPKGFFINLHHMSTNRSTYYSQQFSKFCADRFGLKEGLDYTFDWIDKKNDGSPLFKLNNADWQPIKFKRSKNVEGKFYLEGVLQEPGVVPKEPDLVYDSGYVSGIYVPIEALK